MGLSPDIRLELVDSIDKAYAMKRWASERREVMGLDTETSGLDIFGPNPITGIKPALRTIQLGDHRAGWVIPWDQWGGVAMEILKDYDGVIAAHNWSFDEKWMRLFAGWKIPWDRIHDTMIMANMIYPGQPATLKGMSDKYIDPRASIGQHALEDAMATNKWGWHNVPIDLPAFWQYSALDGVITAHLWSHLRADQRYAKSFDLEMAALRICIGMEDRGIPVDLDYVKEQRDNLEQWTHDAKEWAQTNLGINVVSNAQLVRYFLSQGAPVHSTTPKGAPSVDKKALDLYAQDSNQAVARTAQLVVQIRKYEKIKSSYFDNFLRYSVDGLMHPSIKTMQAITGRMCLPDSHMLFTNRGVISVDDIKVGDMTLDKDNNWVSVLRVHRYQDAEVIERRTSQETIVSTAEHRWVYRPEAGGVERVEALTSNRNVIRLAPQQETKFSPSRRDVSIETEGERLAAIVGFLVSDGRYSYSVAASGEGYLCVNRRATIWQNEGKFYEEIRSVLPDAAVMSDTIKSVTSSGATHREIRLKVRWLRPRLLSMGLDTTSENPLLRENPNLITWISTATLGECAAFLQAVYLADGATAHPQNALISCSSENLQRVLQIAAYRCGYSTRLTSYDKGNSWAVKPRMGVKLKRNTASFREADVSTYVTDVWCVETATGTFTAWDGRPYLTGNSITQPAMQTLHKDDKLVRRAVKPREGHVLISSDLDQVEFRIFAHLSGDEQLQETFRIADETGSDTFTEIGKQIFQDESFHKNDPRRRLVKGVIYGKLFGSGVKKMAETSNQPIEVMQGVHDSLLARYPGIKRFQDQTTRMVESRASTGKGFGYVETQVTGRRLPVEQDKAYTGVNYMIQSTAAEVFKSNLIKIDNAGLGEYTLLPVHDEIILSVPKGMARDAKQELAQLMTTTDDWAVPLTSGADGPFDRWGGDEIA